VRLSEYRKHLATIARRERRLGRDPEVAIPKWSSYSLKIAAPSVMHLTPKPDGEWLDEPRGSDTIIHRYVIVGDY
jgi:hypothetical protein